ncbi:MAG: guanine deaminase [Pseudomonadota bacterium]
MNQRLHIRGAVLSFSAAPDPTTHAGVDYLEDAVVTTESGFIRDVLTPEQFVRDGGNLEHVRDVRPGLILPGFVDTHIHYPQMNIIGSYGRQLMDWLDNYAFPTELKFSSQEFAKGQAETFMDRLAEVGTTTALTFTTVHPHSTDALFEAAHRRNARMIAGKVLMNRNGPDGLLDQGDGAQVNEALLERWHGVGRLAYAVTPRFAITCSDTQLQAAGDLVARYPDVYVHSHISEHPDEVAATMSLFPKAKDYADVYASFGLMTDHAVYAHGIHLSDEEMTRFREHGSSISFCPSSNLFLGSGLLSLERVASFGVGLGVGSDVGGGTDFSLLATIADGYKVAQLGGYSWHPFQAFHGITLAGAEVLHLQDRIGRVAAGYEADMTVLRAQEGSMLAQRLEHTQTLDEQLFAYMFVGTDNSVAETYIAGQRQYSRDERVVS